MTVPSYTEDLTDIDLAESTTGWTEPGDAAWDDGGSATADVDYPYIQGNVAVTQQATKATIAALIYDNGAGITLPTDGAYLVWQVFASSTGLATYANGGMAVMVGSSDADFYAWDVGGVDKGRNPYGGWMNHAVNTTVGSDDTVGTPGATEQFVGAAVRPTVAIGKGNPHGVDALRYGRCSSIFEFGEAANYCTFAGFAAQNDISTNRWGLGQSIAGGYLWKGKMTLGTVTNPVDFRDSNVNILIDDTPKVTANFNTIEINNASSRIDWDNVKIEALGTTSPGRLLCNANADINWNSCQFTNMSTFLFGGSNSTCINNIWNGCGLITVAGGTYTSCAISNTTDTVKAVYAASPAEAALITKTTFVSPGTKHAMEIGGTAANITLVDNVFTGYSTVVDADKALYVNIATGSMTITVSGGSGLTQDSVRTAGCTVTVNSDVTVTFTGMKDNSEVRVYKVSDGSEVAGIEDVTAGSPDDRSFSWAAPATLAVNYVIHNFEDGVPMYETIRVEGYVVPAADTSIGIQQRLDRNVA